MKHLVKVTAEFEFVVLVDDEEDEHQVCENFVAEALRDMSTSDVLFNTEAYHDGCIDGWDGSIEPYNGAGKSTDEWAALLPDNAVGICELMNFAAEFIAAAPAIHEGGEHA